MNLLLIMSIAVAILLLRNNTLPIGYATVSKGKTTGYPGFLYFITIIILVILYLYIIL